jgi:fibronectin-binding autotransporter adhesin
MNRFLSTACPIVTLSSAANAAGVVIVNSNTSLTGNLPGTAIVETFDSVTAGPANFTDGGLTFSGDGAIVMGSVSSAYAEPYTDTTPYLSTGYDGTQGLMTETVTFSQPQWEFGLFWGSMDSYNTLEFYNGSTLVGTFTGDSVTAPPSGANGDQGSFATNRYVNFFGEYTSVEFLSTSPAFEIDNISAGSSPTLSSSVPEPSTWALMLLGLVGLGYAARNQHRKNRLVSAVA